MQEALGSNGKMVPLEKEKENLQLHKAGLKGLQNSGEFFVEYAKSNASHCISCDGRIAKNEIRISQKDYTSERALKLPTRSLVRLIELTII